MVIGGRVGDEGRGEVETLVGVVAGHDGEGLVEVAVAE